MKLMMKYITSLKVTSNRDKFLSTNFEQCIDILTKNPSSVFLARICRVKCTVHKGIFNRMNKLFKIYLQKKKHAIYRKNDLVFICSDDVIRRKSMNSQGKTILR